MGGVSIIGYFSPSPLSIQDIQCLFDNENGFSSFNFSLLASMSVSGFRSEHCLYFSIDSIPEMKVMESEMREVELTIPFCIQHDRILSMNPKEYIKGQCQSFLDSLILESDSSILQTAVHIQEEQTPWKVYSINTKHEHMDGIANLHYLLQFLVYEGESIQSIKQTITECYYRLLIQSLHISAVSGCRVE